MPTKITIGKVPDTTSTSAIAPGEIDTTAAIAVTGCDRILLVRYFDGGSSAYAIDYSPNGTDWMTYKDSTFVNGTPTAVGSWYTWAPPDTAWDSDTTWTAITRDRIDGTPGLKVWHQFAHLVTVGSLSAPSYRSFMFDLLRLRIWNTDTADTMRSNDWSIRCEN
jgi:hypothetical protein